MAIKSVSYWSGYSFAGLIKTDQLVTIYIMKYTKIQGKHMVSHIKWREDKKYRWSHICYGWSHT